MPYRTHAHPWHEEERSLGAISRRAFLRTAAGATALLVVGADRIAPGSTAPARAATSARPGSLPIGGHAAPVPRRSYRSRPDLEPPVITLSGPRTDLAPGYVFCTPANGAWPDGPMIVDDDGDLVWMRPDGGTTRATDVKVATYRGEPVLTWWEGEGLTGYGKGSYVIADSTYREIARVSAANGMEGDLHEFTLTPEGTGLFLVFNTRPGEVTTMRGTAAGVVTEGVIQEVDVASGKLLFEWHSMDHVSVLESFMAMPKGPTEPYDYFHPNSIDVAPDGSLLLSARHTWAVYSIDRGSGAVRWRLGGSRSDFDLGPDVRFAWQHDARWGADGTITIYDDGAHGPPPQFESASRGIIVALDEQRMEATLVRQWIHPDKVLSSSQGSFQLLPNGDAFLGWGNVPRFTEFDAGGRLLFDGTFEGKGSYRAYRFPWIGRPDEAPAMAVDRSGATPTVYASWNGATEVASWTVLAGASADQMAVVASSPRTGFETAIPLPTTAAFVAVRAMGADGRVLGGTGPLAGA